MAVLGCQGQCLCQGIGAGGWLRASELPAASRCQGWWLSRGASVAVLTYRFLTAGSAGLSSSLPSGTDGICPQRPVPLWPRGPCLLAWHQSAPPVAFLMSQNRLGRKLGALVQLGARQCWSLGGEPASTCSSVWSSQLPPAPCSCSCSWRFPRITSSTTQPGPGHYGVRSCWQSRMETRTCSLDWQRGPTRSVTQPEEQS